MADIHPPLVRTRLSILMFLQFFIWGCWGVAICGYAKSSGFSGTQIAWLGSVPAIGAIVSPLFVGLIADRFFAAQRMLCVLHLLGAACLIGAGICGQRLVGTEDPNAFKVLMLVMLLNGLAFMPTLALANAVAFRHIPDADKFPRIAVLGTIGWIVANLISEVFLGGAAKPNFLFLAGVGSILLAFFALTLPDTPPKGAEAGGDVFGLSALKLLKESAFLIFIVCAFLVSIPACGYFFTLMVPMFFAHGYPAPLALGTLNQFAEIIFMFSMPWFVARLGLKRVILIGMTAWAIRYLCFAWADPSTAGFSLTLAGLILHGFCYSFFYVGAYMYIDRRAPAELKASAQSLLAFLLLGVGYLLGAQGAGLMMGNEKLKPDIPTMPATTAEGVKKTDAPLPRWDDPNAATSAWRFLDLSGTVKGLLQKDEGKKEEPQLDLARQLDTNNDGKITIGEIEAIEGDGVTVDKLVYSKENLIDTFNNVHKQLGLEGEVALERAYWLEVQSLKWKHIWLWPSIGLWVVLIFFALAFYDKPDEEESVEEPPQDESPTEPSEEEQASDEGTGDEEAGEGG